MYSKPVWISSGVIYKYVAEVNCTYCPVKWISNVPALGFPENFTVFFSAAT